MHTPQVEIITIGDEILIGQIVDTNSAWMARELNKRGFEVAQITSVHDDTLHIVSAIDAAFLRADVILLTGGLGPTKDDKTKQILCDYFHTHLVHSPEVLANIEHLHAARPRVLNELTRAQALVPEACTVINNAVGTAPVMWFERDGKVLVSMPGVPYEMKTTMLSDVLPRLQTHFDTSEILHRTLLLYGIPESALSLRIADWENQLPAHIHLAYLPSHGLIRLRLSAYPAYGINLHDTLEQQLSLLLPIINDYLIAKDDVKIEELVAQALISIGGTMTVAESCTGGNIASTIVQMAGSSAYFKGSVVTYDNQIKTHVLQVDAQSIEEHGAVSQQVVEQMAENARTLFDTHFAVATSGVAGPTGGTPDKPVGTVWIAVASATGTTSQCFTFGSQRGTNIERATQAALVMLYKKIMGSE